MWSNAGKRGYGSGSSIDIQVNILLDIKGFLTTAMDISQGYIMISLQYYGYYQGQSFENAQ